MSSCRTGVGRACSPAPKSLPCGLPVAACSTTASISTTRPSRPSKTPPAVASRSSFSKRPRCATPLPRARRARLGSVEYLSTVCVMSNGWFCGFGRRDGGGGYSTVDPVSCPCRHKTNKTCHESQSSVQCAVETAYFSSCVFTSVKLKSTVGGQACGKTKESLGTINTPTVDAHHLNCRLQCGQ